ncbi:phage tail tape measure protein [Anaerocolumna xylanovorans]|uniref:Phage tail tape measure protein, TP901 family, core region n=1 Tax=Anaerocolumna xylanovorans DSM 12503 TaxID=1121345 RepID=A0A1M7YBQ5_9FIRM|nr:phage tail tape measure protein [Anaerocolumna xylanovorans]SHO50067.1 phage tail tape measure protein, TP901 family, core region [Anaerocolumna xylanovorans DSM 12503]
MANKTTYELALEIGGKIQSSLDKSVSNANKKLDSIGNTAKKMAKAATAALAGIGIAAFLSNSTNASMEFESSMADVAKVVDGLKDENGNLTQSYYDMSDAIIEMSKNIPMTTSELSSIMAAAGTAGIATEDLQRFTETAAKMGIAFDSTAEQAGEWMAIWRTALGLSQDEVEVLGDQINYLGNTSSENAMKLSEIVTNIGSLAKISGVSGSQLAALGAATTGINSDVAATGLKNMFVAMTAGTSATKKQQEVLEKLGFTSSQVAERMQSDSQSMIVDMLEGINKLPEAEQAAAISNYFGKESLSTVSVLAGNLGNLKEQFDKVADSAAYAGSMEGEYATRAATSENNVQLLKNAFEALKIQIGNMLIPVLTGGVKILNSGISILERFTGKAKGGAEAATNKFTVFSNCISAALDNIASGKGVIQSFEESIKDTLGVSVPDKFKDSIKRIGNEISFLKQNGITAFENLKAKISENKPTIDQVITVAADLKSKLYDAWENSKPTITFIATTALPAVVGAIMKVIGAAGTVYQKLDEWNLLIPIIVGISGAITALKMIKFAKDTIASVKAVKALVTVLLAQKKAMLANLALKAKDKLETAYIYGLYAKDAIVKGVSTAATWAQTAAMTAWNAICAVGTAVTTALGAAFTFLTSPIGLVVLAIAAVIAIGVLLYKNWDTVKEKASQLGDWVVNVFNSLKEKASAAIQEFANRFPVAFAFISSVFESFRQTVSGIFNGVKTFFTGIIQFFTGVFTGDWQKALDGLKNIFSGAFQALSSLAMAPLNHLKGVVTGIFSAIDTATGGKLTSIKNKAVEAFGNIRDKAGEIMGAAKDTIAEKLSNIKSAYEQNGGGIKGIAAASIEGVKGYYTAGYSFLNNLTDGKLDQIRQSFSTKLDAAKTAASEKFEGIKSAISGKLEGAKTVVTNGLNAIKGFFSGCKLEFPSIKLPHFNVSGGEAPWGIAGKGTMPKFSVDWYKDGGILTGPTIFGSNGSSLLGGGEAGKEAVLPLSELWSNMKTVVSGVVSKQPDGATDMFGKVKQLIGGQTATAPTESATKELYNTINNNNTVNKQTENKTSADSSKFVYAPNVVIQGNASKEDVESALDMSQAKFNQMMAEYQRQKGRTSFA